MLLKILITLSLIVSIAGCSCDCPAKKNTETSVKYNIIKPGNGIYVITEKDVERSKIKNNDYEAVYLDGKKVIKIERHGKNDNLTDELSVSAITKFEYNSDDKVKYLKYFDKNENSAVDKEFGYSSIEYVYDGKNRVIMEIYRDANSDLLNIPRDNSGNIAKINFLSPILTYEYIGDKLKIKALDKNFNLLKEVYGDKPCVPFIDCGESD